MIKRTLTITFNYEDTDRGQMIEVVHVEDFDKLRLIRLPLTETIAAITGSLWRRMQDILVRDGNN